jgi:hypothetical protein
MPHSGGDETARRGGAVQGHDHSGEDEVVPNFPMRRGDGAGERTVVGGDRGEAVRGEGMRWLTSRVSLSAVRGRERGRGWRRLTSGDDLSAGVVARAEWAGGGPMGGSREREGGEWPRVWAGNRPSHGETKVSPFFIFIFQFLFLFLYPFLLNN